MNESHVIDRANRPLPLADTLRSAAAMVDALDRCQPLTPRVVLDKSGHKTPGNIYLVRQPNGLVSSLIAVAEERFSQTCDYIDLGKAPEFPKCDGAT